MRMHVTTPPRYYSSFRDDGAYLGCWTLISHPSNTHPHALLCVFVDTLWSQDLRHEMRDALCGRLYTQHVQLCRVW